MSKQEIIIGRWNSWLETDCARGCLDERTINCEGDVKRRLFAAFMAGVNAAAVGSAVTARSQSAAHNGRKEK